MSPPKTAALQSTPRQNPSSGADVEHGILKGHRVQGLLVPNGAKLHDGDVATVAPGPTVAARPRGR
jgi:hypothetical protein